MTSFGLDTRKTQTGESFKIHGDRRNKVPVFFTSSISRRQFWVCIERKRCLCRLVSIGFQCYLPKVVTLTNRWYQKTLVGCMANIPLCQHNSSGIKKKIFLIHHFHAYSPRTLEYSWSEQERINITTKEPTTWGKAEQNLLVLYGRMPYPVCKQSNF